MELALKTFKREPIHWASKNFETITQGSEAWGRGSILRHLSGRKTVYACASTNTDPTNSWLVICHCQLQQSSRYLQLLRVLYFFIFEISIEKFQHNLETSYTHVGIIIKLFWSHFSFDRKDITFLICFQDEPNDYVQILYLIFVKIFTNKKQRSFLCHTRFMVKTTLDSGFQLLDTKCVMIEIAPHIKEATTQNVSKKGLETLICYQRNATLVYAQSKRRLIKIL